MNPRLTVLPADAPDEIDLELLELGAVPDSTDRARIEAAGAGPLSGAAAELARARASFDADAPPLGAASRRGRRDRAREGSGSLRIVAAVLALAAAVLLILGLPRLRPEVDGVRAMGGLTVEVDVRRGGASVDGGALRPGDELLVELRSPHRGFLDVWTRQADGEVSVLVTALPVEPGARIPLPGAVRLDAYRGEEWLLLRFTDTPSTADDLRAVGLDDLAPGRSHAVEVTREP